MERSDEVSLKNGPDPIDRLRATDPVHADEVPDASLARVSARVQENIMNDVDRTTTRRPRRGPLAIGGLAIAAALALAIGLGNGFGTKAPGPIAANPTTTPTENPSPSDNPPGIPGGGGGIASCIRYDTSLLPTFEIVFDGTVTAVAGDQVTFDVNTGWKGVDGSVTLTSPASGGVSLLGPVPDFKVGGRYLVTAAGSNINSCGYTLDYDAATAAEWAAAFAS
jgi:hypothetical protein